MRHDLVVSEYYLYQSLTHLIEFILYIFSNFSFELNINSQRLMEKAKLRIC